ncbi:MAG: BrnT family toxin [Alphaproteobacteria bacterium]
MDKVIRYVWDETKRAENLRKHDIDFAEIAHFEWEHALEEEIVDDNEMRTKAIGPLGQRLLAVVIYTDRSNEDEIVLRIISMRTVTRHERNAYVRQKENED